MLKPLPFAPGIPAMPNGLDKDARTEWRRLVRDLSQRGILCPADATLLHMTCQAYSDLMQFSRLRKHQRAGATESALFEKAFSDCLYTYRLGLEQCTVLPPEHIRLRALPNNRHAPKKKLSARGDQ